MEGTFDWVTGEPITYTNWASGEPNDAGFSGNEDFVEIFKISGLNGRWNDINPGDVNAPTSSVVEFEVLDTDGDGVLDVDDDVINSNTDPTVGIGDCDSGVTNQVLSNGATFNDLIGDVAASAKNHGAFVKQVSRLANDWKHGSLISGKDKGKITSCAARADLP